MDYKLNIKKKILVVTPRFPFDLSGACEQDRSYGVRRLVEMGYEVKVIVKVWPKHLECIQEAQDFSGAEIIPILYTQYQDLSDSDKKKRKIKRFTNPLYIDGACFEYTEEKINRKMEEVLDKWKPDLVWFDYTYLWPLYSSVQKRKIPIITRSINFEPIHFLEEDRYKLLNFIKFIPKVLSEIITVFKTDHMFSITPKEAKIYKFIGGFGKVSNLPLRGLPYKLRDNFEVRDKKTLDLFFMGSTYNVTHNREALKFIVKDLATHMNKEHEGMFRFNITGSKFPSDLEKYIDGVKIIYHGYVDKDKMDEFFNNMDIALTPSFMGAGMQQKIFEPISRGIPSVISDRTIAGYPLKDKVHYIGAKGVSGFADALVQLSDIKMRQSMSDHAKNKTKEIFSLEKIDFILKDVLNNLL